MIFKKREMSDEKKELARTKDFFDMVAPGVIRFYPEHYIVGSSYRCVWAIREYPPQTERQALLARFGERSGVTVRVYHRLVTAAEQRQIMAAAERKNKFQRGSNDLTEQIDAEGNLQDMMAVLADERSNRNPFLHCAVFLELRAASREELENLKAVVGMELTSAKLAADRLFLRQKEGFLTVLPWGTNQFGTLYERVLPASSVANLFPLSFSGRTDPNGMYIGKDKYGGNIVGDLARAASDKTNGSILILGNSGEGKSYLAGLLMMNLRESGRKVICFDPEGEYEKLCSDLGGCYMDILEGKYIINPLEPHMWSCNSDGEEEDEPAAFTRGSLIDRHIAYLKDFFRSYRDFPDAQIDTLEILLQRLYHSFGITDATAESGKYPTMRDLYDLVVETYQTFDPAKPGQLMDAETLRELSLGLRSICVGAESKYFNGTTNVTDSDFIVFGVKGLQEANRQLRSALMFNLLSYMSGLLLEQGNAVAAIDELHLFLDNPVAIEYIRGAMKRARKRGSALLLASQNVEDFLLPGVREYTKPLFSIPTHHFLFYPGQINAREYMDALQLEQSEYELIRNPEQGRCLYRAGRDRYLLKVTAPGFKHLILKKEAAQ